ncbi:MAG: DUF1080 domain-containing protein, partial [Planctomycetes bacterium]|nr:DUF1080 domain-containing protein [Planctomycetota bacterium]
GPVDRNLVKDGAIHAGHGTIYTEKEYSDFTVRFEFKLPPGGNNGLAIRYPGSDDTAYHGLCELQVLDNPHPSYHDKLNPRQYHGSAYAMVPSRRGFLRPAGEWNYQVVTVKGFAIQVDLNGTRILDTDLHKVDPKTFMYPLESFKGRNRTKGHFGFAGHGSAVLYRNIEIKELP